MTSRESALHVEVLDDEIVITLPGTNYAVTYYRATAFPQRLLTKSHSGGEGGCSGFRPGSWGTRPNWMGVAAPRLVPGAIAAIALA
jgi:hypothetical protein